MKSGAAMIRGRSVFSLDKYLSWMPNLSTRCYPEVVREARNYESRGVLAAVARSHRSRRGRGLFRAATISRRAPRWASRWTELAGGDAHAASPRRARAIVTFNTLVFDHELTEAARALAAIAEAGADAIIVQDLGGGEAGAARSRPTSKFTAARR